MRQTDANRLETVQEEVNGTSGTPYRLFFRSNLFKRRGFIDENYYITAPHPNVDALDLMTELTF